MTIEADLTTVLGALAGGRCFPDVAPIATTRPYIVYQQVGGVEIQFLERAVPSKQNGRFQVSVWADTRSAAAALMGQVASALVLSTAFQASAMAAPVALYDEDLARYGARQDFSIWSDR